MTAQEFREIALSLPGTEERSHMDHPDFRVGGKIFATLGHPNQEYGVIMLSPAQQKKWVRAKPDAFAPAQGAWGRGDNTRARLAALDESTLREAINAAWRKCASKNAAGPRGPAAE
jgi:hypothetical protein